MVHIANRDPPDSSLVRDPRPDRTAKSEPLPAGAPGPQNAQRSRSRRSLEFHRIPHSFPDYGSPKGAVKMPWPNIFVKALAPFNPVDTLNSSPRCPPNPRPASPTSTPDASVRPPPPKRQKFHTDARRLGPEEDIADMEQDGGPRAARNGSQTSLAHSMSPGVSEFHSVEASTQSASQYGRSNRRTRRAQTNRAAATTEHRRRSGTRGEPEPVEESYDDSFDVLAPAPKPTARQQRTARLVSTAGARHNPIAADPADPFFFPKSGRSRHHQHGVGDGKKPSTRDRNDYDMLRDEASGGHVSNSNARTPAGNSGRHSAPSLSRKGDMTPTRFAKKRNADATVAGVRVEAAVCRPNLRYLAGSAQDHCLLRPANEHELLAFTEDGAPSSPHSWLKITGKVKALYYHPDSRIIKVHQALDQSSSPPIGAMMVCKFLNKSDASWVADWARQHLRTVEVNQESDSHKLNQIYDKASQDVSQAAQASAARPSQGGSAPRLRRLDVSSIPVNVQSGSMQSSSRTPIRHQMQISTRQQSSLLSPADLARESASYGSHRMRTRQSLEEARRIETSPVHLVTRWSEEQTRRFREWNIPLVFNRTTVDKEDIPRLDEGQCLNDNLIGFGLRYLFDKFRSRHQDLRKRVYLHNSFFYEKLKAPRGAINYDGVRSWTAKVDLLSYDYIVVPVNEHFHWWVAIICNPAKLDPDFKVTLSEAEKPNHKAEGDVDKVSSDVEMTDVPEVRSPPRPSAAQQSDHVESDIVDLVSGDKNAEIDLTSNSGTKQGRKTKVGAKYNLEDPRIITLDSLGSSHPQAIAHLKKYLLAEFEHKRKKKISNPAQMPGMRATNIPEQNNLCDCGVYLLGYIQEFVKNPDQFIRTLLNRERPDWDFNPSDLREKWRDTTLIEQELYQKQPQRGQSEKLGMQREISGTPKGSAGPSRNVSRETSAVAPPANNGNQGLGADSSKNSSSAGSASTPTVSDAHMADDSPLEPPTRSPPVRTDKEAQDSAAVAAPSPAQNIPEQGSIDEDVVLIPSQHEVVAVLPSVEEPEVVELSQPPNGAQDEPRFIAQLSSSTSRSRSPDDNNNNNNDDDDSHVTEVAPKSFYSSAAAKRNEKRKRSVSIISSPTVGDRRFLQTAEGQPAPHINMRFAVDETPDGDDDDDDDVSVVEKAELVRDSGPIDLT